MRSFVVIALVLLALVPACARRGGGLLATGTTVNPIVGGTVNGTPLIINDGDSESRHGLANGAVSHSARLLRADAGEICFEITVSAPEDEGAWANPSAWEARLISSTAPDVNTAGTASVMPTGSSAVTLPGTIPEEQYAGTETYCAEFDSYNNCISWATQPVYNTIYIPHTWVVHTGVGQVCWPNTEVLTAETEWLRLRLVDPANPSGRVGAGFGFVATGRVGLNFEWELAR